jgi:hypothetical protein
VTSVPSRTPSSPPTSQELQHLFEEKNKNMKLNTDKSKKYSHNKLISKKKNSENLKMKNNSRNKNEESSMSGVHKDLKYYLSNLPPPCQRCVKSSERLGFEIRWANSVTNNGDVVISSRLISHISHREKKDKECSPTSSHNVPKNIPENVPQNVPKNVLYGSNRCRQVLLRNAHLLPR